MRVMKSRFLNSTWVRTKMRVGVCVFSDPPMKRSWLWEVTDFLQSFGFCFHFFSIEQNRFGKFLGYLFYFIFSSHYSLQVGFSTSYPTPSFFHFYFPVAWQLQESLDSGLNNSSVYILDLAIKLHFAKCLLVLNKCYLGISLSQLRPLNNNISPSMSLGGILFLFFFFQVFFRIPPLILWTVILLN